MIAPERPAGMSMLCAICQGDNSQTAGYKLTHSLVLEFDCRGGVMRILFLAPQPFFQERGTPIAVRLALRVLAERRDDHIDLLTYHEGERADVRNVRQFRIWMPACVRNIGPGISLKKLACDLSFAVQTFMLVWRNRREPYQLVHAVEESVFIAWLVKLVWKIPYIYDMDSSLALQLAEKWWLLRPFSPVLEWCEKLAVQGSMAVVPVCDALAAIAQRHGSPLVQVLSDVSLLEGDSKPQGAANLRSEAGLGSAETVALYIGNLENYQGIDLLLDSFARIAAECPLAHVIVIGGRSVHIEEYRSKARSAGLSQRVHFLGPRPVESLNCYLTQADILISPRTKGNNTPMKIYSYLHSGVPVIATDLPTHTQVLTPEVAVLAAPQPDSFGLAMRALFLDPALRARIGSAARALAQRKYTFEHFRNTLNQIYDRVAEQISRP